jgi:hypothetical protein
VTTDNAKGFATVDEWIKGLRSLPAMVKAAPSALVPIVKAECDATIAAGKSLDGEQWEPTVRGNQQALAGTQKDLTVEATSNVLWIRIRNGLVFGHFGTHRQKARHVLPASGIPSSLGNAIRLGVVDMLPEFMTRKGGHRKPTRGIRWQ